MKSTGVVRRLDDLGRITLPKELRRSLNFGLREGLDISVDGDAIILTKASMGDIFDGSTEDLIEYKGKLVSRHSIREMARLAGFTLQ